MLYFSIFYLSPQNKCFVYKMLCTLPQLPDCSSSIAHPVYSDAHILIHHKIIRVIFTPLQQQIMNEMPSARQICWPLKENYRQFDNWAVNSGYFLCRVLIHWHCRKTGHVTSVCPYMEVVTTDNSCWIDVFRGCFVVVVYTDVGKKWEGIA